MPARDICRQNAHKVVGEIKHAYCLQCNVCSICLPLQPCSHLLKHKGRRKSSCKNMAITILHLYNLLGLLSAGVIIPCTSSGISINYFLFGM